MPVIVFKPGDHLNSPYPFTSRCLIGIARCEVIGHHFGMAIELTDELMSKWPPHAQAVVRLLSARIAELEAEAARGSGENPAKTGKIRRQARFSRRIRYDGPLDQSAIKPGMNPLSDNPLSILSFIVAPALLTNASSLLTLGTGNRFARAIDRTRMLAAEVRAATDPNDPTLEVKREQLHYAERRTLHLVRSLTAFYLAIGAFAGASLLSLLGAVFHVGGFEGVGGVVLLIALLSGIVGVAALVVGTSLLVYETRMALYILGRETKLTLERIEHRSH